MIDPKDERRREERCDVRLPADLVRGKQRVTLVSGNVSFRGIFLRTERPLPERRLLQVAMLLPPEDKRVTVHGTVIHVVRPGSGRVPGMGIEIVGQDGEEKAIWEAFVRHVRPRRKGPPSAAESPQALAECARRFERYRSELRLRVDEPGDLLALAAQDVPKGGMFVATTLSLPIGMGHRLHVLHPETDETFELDCVVRRRELDSPGVRVEIESLDEPRRAAFLEFVKNDTPALSATEEYVDESVIDEWEEEEPTNVVPRQIVKAPV